ncbi:UDP-glucuronosyltransferase 2C1 isoform X1 [Equus caballus]|uniref:UDP-glucuronosyltransferase 2C1 isoform X1 n=2 Tax=Equus caballus TaxID=9796 RepID=UPI0038B2CABC
MMKTAKGFCVLFMLHLCFFDSGRTGKVLVWPMDFSHWINLKVILEELHLRGHEITILVPSPSLLMDHTKIPFNVEILQLPVTKETLLEELNTVLYVAAFELPKLSWWDMQVKLTEMSNRFSRTAKRVCDSAITNKELLSRLQAAKFDICISDPLSFCGELLAELLDIPFVYSFRFSFGNFIERLCAGLPTSSSYVPGSTSGLTDNMTFVQRLRNWFLYVMSGVIYSYFLLPEWNEYYSKVLGKPTTVCETMGKAEMWLIRTSWEFEFPYPYLPHFEFVGGLHCKPAKPLPKELEEFVQSSGKDGVVIFTLGSMIHNLTEEKSNMIASALAQIPQKVLWRYTGKKPDTLGPNTRLYDWIPQNDLLGHPKTRAFITHCGTNGIYEAIYHGVPMVGIPMFGDQVDNIARIKAKGAAVDVDMRTMTSSDLLKALKAVINNPSYKENAMRLSRIHHDQSVKPLDRAVFWIEFVMRHKGAKHLRPASYNLTWYQYHSLDVLGFLLACVATIIFLVTKCCLFCCWKFGKTGKKKKRE